MPKFHVSCSVTVDVIIEVEAEEHSSVHHLVKNHLVMTASLSDTDANTYQVIEDSITDLEDLTVTKD